MPYSLEIDESLGCIFARWHGRLTARDITAFYGDVEAHPDFRPGLKRFHDLRQADLDLDQAELRSVAEVGKLGDERHGQRQVAFLVGSETSFGVARMLMSMREPCNLNQNVFREFERATAWLKLPAELDDPLDTAEQ